MKKQILAFLLLVFIFSCTTMETERPKANEIEITWRNLESLYQGKEQFLSEFEFKNTGSKDLKFGNWAFYFNTIRSIQPESNPMVKFEHVNGDLYRMLPRENFNLSAGELLKIPFVSDAWVISKTDAPVGGFFVFNDSIIENCKPIFVDDFEFGKQTTRRKDDIMPIQTAKVRFEKLQAYGISKLEESELLPIIPSPTNFSFNGQVFFLDSKTQIVFDADFEKEAQFLAKSIEEDLGLELKISAQANETENVIYLKKTSAQANLAESYKLNVRQSAIEIYASAVEGAFYAVQSLRALIPSQAYAEKKSEIEIKGIEISDNPRFQYRGMHFDVARNFQSKESLLKLLDAMAFYKMNKLHLHFCDDEGWRIEINGLPELTEIGSKRAFTVSGEEALLPSFGSGAFAEGNSGSGFYSRHDFIEILKFANERKIEVIPEIDAPGHSRAAIVSMNYRYKRLMKEGKKEEAEKYLLVDLDDKSEYKSVQGWNDNVVCVGRESVYSFLEKVVSEFAEMYKEAGVEFKTVHTGGDEVPAGVWEISPICNQVLAENDAYSKSTDLAKYFIDRYNRILEKYKLKTAGWEEIALEKGESGYTPVQEFSGRGFIPFVWNNVWTWGMEDIAYQLANDGFPVVLCNVTNLYFDMAYEKHPEEPGYYWGAFTDTRTPFEFTPFDVRNCSYTDLMGNPIDAYKMFEGKQELEKTENIIGMQAEMWAENMKSQEMMEYMIFPKLLAFAERAWSEQPGWAQISDKETRLRDLNADWNVFANTLGQQEFLRLDNLFGGVGYRLSPPAAIVENGILKVMSEFPGMQIRYTTDGSEPTMSSELYSTEVKVEGKEIRLATFSSSGRNSRVERINIQ